MNLTTEQLQAAEQGPVTVEANGKEYVLLSKEVCNRVKQVRSYSSCDFIGSFVTLCTTAHKLCISYARRHA